MYNFYQNFTEIYSSYDHASIGSDDGLAPTRWQAIVWTNDGYFTDANMHHWASMS